MRRVSGALATKLDGLAYRISLLNEVTRLEAKGRSFPRTASRLLWRNPTRYDDFVEMVNFVDNNGPVDLIDIGANHGDFARDFHMFYPNNGRILCFEPNPGLAPTLRETLRTVPN